jgi:exodeoxyribonuclease V alpha subunit
MKPQPEPSTEEVLAGLVERVTFHNDENGFCVLRAKARGHRDLVTVIGHAAAISAGEWITTSGEWVNDRTHGQQFKARFMRTSAPTSIDGIEKYLGSGMIRGIGPVYAKKLVRAFGEKVFDTIEAEPELLREVTGIGPVRARRITDAWAEQKIIREIMIPRTGSKPESGCPPCARLQGPRDHRRPGCWQDHHCQCDPSNSRGEDREATALRSTCGRSDRT